MHFPLDFAVAVSGLSALAVLTLGALPLAGAEPLRVAVVVGPRPSKLEARAARELCGYLQSLFGLEVGATSAAPSEAEALFLVGRPDSCAEIRAVAAARPWPPLSDQGIVLRRTEHAGRPALLVGGGSPVATLWAVYELAERWGVRHLLHSDVLPSEPTAPPIPDLDLVMEPSLRVRQWRAINDFACGPESWGIADYLPVLDQLSKLKFNRLFVNIYPYQPFLHLEMNGCRRQSANLWYNFHYPITDDMPGRGLFGEQSEFWNPDLPLGASYEELAAAGERHVHALMAAARERGMQIVMDAVLTEFPREFAPLLPGATPVHQLGEMTIVPGPDTAVDAPAVTSLAAMVLQTTVNTYPEVDFISLGMPEFRQWAGAYEQAWRALDAKYGIERVCPLAQVLAAAESRTSYPGGAERALQEVKGDLVALYFYDHLLTDLKVLQDTRRPDVRFIFNSVAEELYPILPRVVPPGSELLNFVDYTPSRILARRQVLRNIPTSDVPSILIYTLHDDNIGLLPQLTTGSLHELTRDLRQYGWAGFSTRYWLIGDHDPCVAYLARAAWDDQATPEAVYRDQVRVACGDGCVEDMLAVFREVEATTVALEWHGLGLTFPVPGMMMRHWVAGPIPEELVADRAGYQRALAAARRAREKAAGEGAAYVDYWVGRLQFAVGYLDAVEAVHWAATAEAEGRADEARGHAQAALDAARGALEAYARVARDRSDLGALAVMAEYVYRPLRDKVEELGRGTG